MSATVETPIVPGPVQGPTREEPLIEALLLDDYRSLVHLAYLILPPSISRALSGANRVVEALTGPREVFGDRQRAQRDAQPHTRRLVHLAVHERGLVDDA